MAPPTGESATRPDGTDLFHIHLPPEVLVEQLGKLGVVEAAALRRQLADSALEIHDTTLRQVVGSGHPAHIPSSAVWPAVVGTETVAAAGLHRRRAGCGLVPSTADPAKHLILPPKKVY